MRISEVVTKREDIEAVFSNDSKRYEHSRDGPSEQHIENDNTEPSPQLGLMPM